MRKCLFRFYGQMSNTSKLTRWIGWFPMKLWTLFMDSKYLSIVILSLKQFILWSLLWNKPLLKRCSRFEYRFSSACGRQLLNFWSCWILGYSLWMQNKCVCSQVGIVWFCLQSLLSKNWRNQPRENFNMFDLAILPFFTFCQAMDMVAF